MRYCDCVAVFFCDGLQGLIQALASEKVITRTGAGVVTLHDERRRIVQDETLNSPGDSLKRVFCQPLFTAKN
ncbi:Uncharacterised protein [Enterobacter cloacae]|nr:Uncharacterised protein [Enterobacter cloacae]